MSTVEDLRTVSVEDADAEARAATAELRDVSDREALLSGGLVRDSDGHTVRVDDPLQRELLHCTLLEERRAAVGRAVAAQAALKRAKCGRAADRARELAADHATAADRLLDRRAEAEAALAALVVAAWQLMDADEQERVAAQALAAVVMEAVPNDEAQRDLERRLRNEVPIAVGPSGALAWRDRPRRGLFDGGVPGASDPVSPQFGSALVTAIRSGERITRANAGAAMLAALDAASYENAHEVM